MRTVWPSAGSPSSGSGRCRLFDGVAVDEGFRLDLLVGGRLLIELKSVERLAPVHGKQVLTYSRLMALLLGLLMNFGAPTFREALKRVVNGHHPKRLCVFA